MNILLIDTATELLCTALSFGTTFYLERLHRVGLRHSELLMPDVEALLHEAVLRPRDLELVVCSRGPGSFTGLRIGMATAKGIAQGAQCPLVSVPTLDALAYGLEHMDRVIVPVVDARKQRYYAACYREGRRISDYLDVTADELSSQLRRFGSDERMLLTGPAALAVAGHLAPPDGAVSAGLIGVDVRGVGSCAPGYMSLAQQLLASRGPDPIDAGPMYIRKSDAELSMTGQGSGGA